MSNSEENPHSPPGPYILFDNLDRNNRLFFNVWTIYDENSIQQGLYMKYLYIYCKGHKFCINLWNLDIIEIDDNLNKNIEWDKAITSYAFFDSLKQRKVNLNGKIGTYLDFISILESNKKIRNIIFKTGDIKTLTMYDDVECPFKYTHQLVRDENRPFSDDEWDISVNVKLRFRIDFDIKITDTKRMHLQFDRGSRGMPFLKPIGWYPTRDMNGILISKDKALPIPSFTYKEPIK